MRALRECPRGMQALLGAWQCLVVLLAGWMTAVGDAVTFRTGGKLNTTEQLKVERLYAEDRWHRGLGMLWFQHYRRAGGTSLCHLLRGAVPAARFPVARGEACQPEDWTLRDAMSICDHNLTLVGLDLRMQGWNAFAQEYGPIPGPVLMGHRAQRYALRDWVFVFSLRDPWQRFWSQLKYELATCLMNAKALAICIGADFDSLGHWWSPTAHKDSVLGVPGARISESPSLYVDNYYTRILLNRTDVSTGPLNIKDLYEAMDLLEQRVSAVIIIEEFATSGLQLACSLGLDLERAYSLLQKHVRPYEAQEALLQVPKEEAELGQKNIDALKSRFLHKNWADYSLYSHARLLSRQRLAACAQRRPDVKRLWRNPPPVLHVKTDTGKKQGDALPDEISVDDLFGCNGGSVDLVDGQYMLKCPRNAGQHSDSWWSSQSKEDAPKRKRGQAAIGAECWKTGFTWSSCCSKKFGDRGNKDCWDRDFTFDRCCVDRTVLRP